jgi:hypothetical protein
MAVFLNNKVGVKINTVDLSDHVTSITLNRTFDELEVSAMGDTSHKFVKGLESSSVTIDFLNDTATGEVLQTLQAAWGTSVPVVIKQSSAAVSATNPSYTMQCLVNSTTDVNGSVADLSMQSVTWNVNGTIAVAVA